MAKFFSPAVSTVARRLCGSRDVSEVATRSWQIESAEERSFRGAVFLPEELARITGYTELSDPETELARTRPRTVWRRPTVVHLLEDVVVSGGDLYKGRFKQMVRGDPRRICSRIPTQIPDGGVFTTSWLGGKYFGHWLSEDVPLKILGREYGEPTELTQMQTQHQRAYSDLFEIAPRALPDFAKLDKLVIIDTDLCSGFRDRGWSSMTTRIHARFTGGPRLGCMLLRGSAGQKRLLVNELQIASWLERLGFAIVDPATTPLDEMLALVSQSKVVVGVEGSQLAHGVHSLSQNGALLVLQPPFRFGCMDKDRCDRKGCIYAFCIGQEVAGGFKVELASVEQVLDKVLREIDTSDGVEWG